MTATASLFEAAPPLATASGVPRGECGAGRACRICGAATAPGYVLCRSCATVAVALDRVPVPVTALAVVTAHSALYRALRQYKGGEAAVARRQADRLSAFLAEAMHRGDVAGARACDATVVVPSGPGGRRGPHPLQAVVRRSGVFPPVLDALEPGAHPVGHRRPDPAAYRVRDVVGGRRIVLVDDVYTSGAHLQSAAAALLDGGADGVRAVVVGRYRQSPGPPWTAGSRRSGTVPVTTG